jgi:hypothetical protein
MDGTMRARIFISTNGRGVSRAIRGEDEKWSVDFLLDGQDIRCLATDPLNPTVVFAGRQEGGILLSRDQGLSWQEVGLSEITVKSLAVSNWTFVNLERNVKGCV